MAYRTAAEPSGDAEALALGAYYRRLLRLRLWVVVPSLAAAAVVAAWVAFDAFASASAAQLGVGAVGWGMVAAIAGSFGLVSMAGWSLYRGLLRWRNASWMPQLARWYGVPRDLLEERALPFHEGPRLDPTARRELRWRVVFAATVGLLTAIVASSVGGWMMGIH